VRPQRGPVRYLVSAADVDINGGSTLEVDFRFPRPVFATGLLMTLRNPQDQYLANVSLRIQDETQQDMIFDGVGGYTGRPLAMFRTRYIDGGPFFTDLMKVRTYQLQRPVFTGDRWFFTIRNSNGEITIRPELIIEVAEGTEAVR
jgi:hypothetical protein